MQYELEMQSDDSSNGEDDDSIDGVPSSSFDKDWDRMSLAVASSFRAGYSGRIVYLCIKKLKPPMNFRKSSITTYSGMRRKIMKEKVELQR